MKKLSLVFWSTFFCLFLACSERKNTQQSAEHIPKIAPESELLNPAFTKLINKFQDFKPQKIIDYPPTEWGKIYVDQEKRLTNREVEQLLKTNIEQYSNLQDSLITFVKKLDLQKASIYPVGQLKHSQEQKITILLLFLKTETKAFAQKHYLLSYFSSKSGKPLGYDLLAGMVRNTKGSWQYYGRWGIRNQQVWINRFCLKKSGENFKAQKYKVVFNQALTKQSKARASEERLFELRGTPKNIQGIKYRFHSDKKVGYSIGFPYEIFTYSASTATLGVSEDFVSQDQKAQLTFYRVYTIDEAFINQQGQINWKKYYNSHKQAAASDGNKLTYSYFDKSYFVLSGIREDGRIFYEKHQGNTHFSLVYPKAQKSTYDNIAKHLVQTFKVK